MTDPYTCPECGKPTRGDTFVCHACTGYTTPRYLPRDPHQETR